MNIEPAFTDLEVTEALAAYVNEYGGKMTAKLMGVSPQFISDCVSGRRRITGKVLKHLGFERVEIIRSLHPEHSHGRR